MHICVQLYLALLQNCYDCMTDKLLLALASTAIFGSEPHGTYDSVLLSDCSRSLRALRNAMISRHCSK
jgi:hypothetical protein